MKKLFSIVLCISTFVVSSAQNFSELDLIGKWNGISGEIMAFEVNNKSKVNWNFDAKGSNFGQLKYSNNESGKYYISDIFITSGNVLHIYICQNTTNNTTRLRFIIKSLTNDELTLSTISGTNDMVFKKNEASNVRYAKTGKNESNDYYNLQGEKLNGPSEKEIYIHDGKKFVAK